MPIDTSSIGYYILLYGIGILAITLSVIAFQFKHRITIVLSNFFGQVCWVMYFLLQADFTSAVACGLSAIMLAVFAQKDRWKWATGKISVTVFATAICGFSLVTFATWKDIFPLLAGFFAVIANSRSDEKRLRQFSLPWCLFWMANSILKAYPVALVSDVMCTASTIIALIRYRKKGEKKDDKKVEQ